jgi:hypothetical protein
MLHTLLSMLVFCMWTVGAAAQTATATSSAKSRATDQEISDAYIYLLGRLLILRQQQLDFQEGFNWNKLVHRKPGDVQWPNPNLDVAYSEAWVAVDEKSCLLVSVPKISKRYYTVQFLNGWGRSRTSMNAFFLIIRKASSPYASGGRT